MSTPITPQDPFSAEEANWLNAFLPTVSSEQALWLRGYLAHATAGTTAAAAPVKTSPLTILFGTETGNAETLAKTALQQAKAAGLTARLAGMDTYKQKDLAKEENLLVICSTWGEGDPPESAVDFYEFVHGDKAPSLSQLRYSVLSLGDSSYEFFCKTGKDFDQRFGQLGAKSLFPRQDCDVDYDSDFQKWITGALAAFQEVMGSSPAAVAAAPVASVSSYDRKNPFAATISENINLNGRGSAKQTQHIEIDLAGSGLTYQPGDALGVFPSNDSQYVADLLQATGLDGDSTVSPDDQEMPLSQALTSYYDITTLSKPILKKYAELSQSSQAQNLLDPANKEKVTDYLYGRELIDLFIDFPGQKLSQDDFLGLLRKMPARLYSIASSLSAHEDEVHLTVGTVRYQAHGRNRQGVCSTFLADRAEGDGKVPVYIHANKNFKLPQDPNTPIIMVGPGTGIAPFRSFIEERAATDAPGKNWLFFGDQHFTTDFLYQLEWQDYVEQGLLHKIDLAFSRDSKEKVYVQHRMMEHSQEIYQWLKDGAYFYVCGDASRMAKDVHQALIDIAVQEGNQSEKEATAFIKQLQKDKRYQRDVY